MSRPLLAARGNEISKFEQSRVELKFRFHEIVRKESISQVPETVPNLAISDGPRDPDNLLFFLLFFVFGTVRLGQFLFRKLIPRNACGSERGVDFASRSHSLHHAGTLFCFWSLLLPHLTLSPCRSPPRI
jgi:hypothetical protein